MALIRYTAFRLERTVTHSAAVVVAMQSGPYTHGKSAMHADDIAYFPCGKLPATAAEYVFSINELISMSSGGLHSMSTKFSFLNHGFRVKRQYR